MQAWCLGVVAACLAGILAGTVCLKRARGMRIVSGRSAANMAYLGLFAAAVLVFMMGSLAVQVYPVVSGNPDLSRLILPIILATGVAMAGSLVCLWRCARSFGRSLIFHNIRRDDLALAVAAVLRESRVAASHRLRTFRDDFVLPNARLVVHGAVCMSRLEWIGPEDARRTQILDATIERLKQTLQTDGRVLLDGRGA